MAQQKKDKQQADKSPSASPLPSKRERSALTVIWLNTGLPTHIPKTITGIGVITHPLLATHIGAAERTPAPLLERADWQRLWCFEAQGLFATPPAQYDRLASIPDPGLH